VRSSFSFGSILSGMFSDLIGIVLLLLFIAAAVWFGLTMSSILRGINSIADELRAHSRMLATLANAENQRAVSPPPIPSAANGKNLS